MRIPWDFNVQQPFAESDSAMAIEHHLFVVAKSGNLGHSVPLKVSLERVVSPLPLIISFKCVECDSWTRILG